MAKETNPDMENKRSFYIRLKSVLGVCLVGINENNKADVLKEISECEQLAKFSFDGEFASEVEEMRKCVFEIAEAYEKLQGKNALPLGRKRDSFAEKKAQLFKRIGLYLEELKKKSEESRN